MTQHDPSVASGVIDENEADVELDFMLLENRKRSHQTVARALINDEKESSVISISIVNQPQ